MKSKVLLPREDIGAQIEGMEGFGPQDGHYETEREGYKLKENWTLFNPACHHFCC